MTSYTLADVTQSTLTYYNPNVITMDNSTNISDFGNVTSDLNTTTDSGGKFGDLKKYAQFWMALYINRYCLRVITAIGFPGNILSFITILKMKPYSHPSIYVAVLAISDNCCLLAKILFMELTRYDVDVGPYGCKFLFFIGNTTNIYANWILVLMTVERFMAIWFPLKVGTFCTRRRAAVAMGCLLIFVAALCSIFFVIGVDVWNNGDLQCVFKKEYENFALYVWYWIDGTFYALLPCLLLTIFNALIIVGIKRAASIQRQLIEDRNSRHMSGHAAEKVRQQRQITIMLVVVCVAFIVLILPNCIFFIYMPYWKRKANTVEEANFKFTEQVVYMLSDFSHAVNFFIYFISTKKFRDRFIETIVCCRQWKGRITRFSLVGQSQFSDTGSIYVSSITNGGGIPLSLRHSGKI